MHDAQMGIMHEIMHAILVLTGHNRSLHLFHYLQPKLQYSKRATSGGTACSSVANIANVAMPSQWLMHIS